MEKKLREGLQFKIVMVASYRIINGKAEPYVYPIFTDLKGKDLPDYKRKLTPTQWRKASEYLDRRLIPFCGYTYNVKEQYLDKKEIIIK